MSSNKGKTSIVLLLFYGNRIQINFAKKLNFLNLFLAKQYTAINNSGILPSELLLKSDRSLSNTGFTSEDIIKKFKSQTNRKHMAMIK